MEMMRSWSSSLTQVWGDLCEYYQESLSTDKYQEGFLLVVEDSSPLGPVALHAGHLEVGVSGHEEEVIIHQLLAHRLSHPGERKVGPGQVSAQVGEGLLHEVLHAESLVLGDPGRQTWTEIQK